MYRILFFSFLTFQCSTNTSQEVVKNPDISKDNTIQNGNLENTLNKDSISTNTANKHDCKYDTTINGEFVLNNADSFRKYFAQPQMTMYNDRLYFISKDSTSYISLGVNFGGNTDEFKDVYVCRIENQEITIPAEVQDYFDNNNFNELEREFNFLTCPYYQFITESNIQLNITETDFCKSMSGINMNKFIEGNIITYQVKDEYCMYEATYKFERTKLTSFKFGYITP